MFVRRALGIGLVIPCLVASLCFMPQRGLPVKDLVYLEEVLNQPITSANLLTGGLSGARLVKIETPQGVYVARYLEGKSTSDAQKEIAAMQIASRAGYGPRIQYTDIKNGLILMDYVASDVSSVMCLETKRRTQLFADVLHAIHTGPAFATVWSLYDEIYGNIDRLEAQKCRMVEADVLRGYMNRLAAAVRKHTTLVPCHNDLNPNNMIVHNDALILIDYEYAAQNDPYFDLGTVALFCCLDTKQEKKLLKKYLGHRPYKHERAKYYLFKHVALLHYGAGLLTCVPSQVVDAYICGDLGTTQAFFAGVAAGEVQVDTTNPSHVLMLAINMLHAVDDYMHGPKVAKHIKRLR